MAGREGQLSSSPTQFRNQTGRDHGHAFRFLVDVPSWHIWLRQQIL